MIGTKDTEKLTVEKWCHEGENLTLETVRIICDTHFKIHLQVEGLHYPSISYYYFIIYKDILD